MEAVLAGGEQLPARHLHPRHSEQSLRSAGDFMPFSTNVVCRIQQIVFASHVAGVIKEIRAYASVPYAWMRKPPTMLTSGSLPRLSSTSRTAAASAPVTSSHSTSRF